MLLPMVAVYRTATCLYLVVVGQLCSEERLPLWSVSPRVICTNVRLADTNVRTSAYRVCLPPVM
jgi:hypothetical protein